jgi:hypothetical protein
LTVLDALFAAYSFEELVHLIFVKLGFGSLIVLLGAYFAAIVFFSSLPAKSSFSTDTARSKAVSSVQQIFYIFSLTILLMPFISGWFSFFLVLFLYVVVAVPMLINVLLVAKDFTFDEYVKFRRGGFKAIWQKFGGIALVWFSVLSELLAFSHFDPTIPLLGWVLIAYTIALAILQATLAQSYLVHVNSCLYARITTVEDPIEGFIVAKGSDHYTVKTKESDVLLSSDYVRSISRLPLPEQSDNPRARETVTP